MHVQAFDLATVPPAPWKNGGGSTRELACWPPGAGMDRFGWRVSVARIAAPGPFSVFPGVDRHILLLDGGGVALAHAGQRWAHRLDTPWQPFAFSGDDAVDCRLLAGPSTDLNLMLRRGAWDGALQVGSVPPAWAGADAGLCLVLQGQWRMEAVPGPGAGEGAAATPARTLGPGQGFWWHAPPASGAGAAPCPVLLADAQSAAPAPALAWVALRRAGPKFQAKKAASADWISADSY